MSNVAVAQLVKQADRLRTQRSGRSATVDDDVRVAIGQCLSRAGPQLCNRYVDGAVDVRGGIRLGRQDVDEGDVT